MKKTSKFFCLFLLLVSSLLLTYFNILIFESDEIFFKDNLDDFPCTRITKGSGKSMLPTIKPEELVLVDYCYNQDSLVVGDIILFNHPLGTAAHRIIFIGNYKIITKGDNNRFPDDPIAKDKFVGKLIEIL